MRRRLNAVDADMLPVLWLPDPVSAEKGTRRRPGSGVLHTDVGDLVLRVERLQQTNSKHVPRHRQHPCNDNHVRKTWVQENLVMVRCTMLGDEELCRVYHAEFLAWYAQRMSLPNLHFAASTDSTNSFVSEFAESNSYCSFFTLNLKNSDKTKKSGGQQ